MSVGPLRHAHDLAQEVNRALIREVLDIYHLGIAKAYFGGLWIEDLPSYFWRIVKKLEKNPDIREVTIKVGREGEDHHVFFEVVDVK